MIAPSCVGGTGEEVTCEAGTGEEGRCWVNGASSASFLGIVIGEEERGSGNGCEEGRVGNVILGIYLVEGDLRWRLILVPGHAPVSRLLNWSSWSRRRGT